MKGKIIAVCRWLIVLLVLAVLLLYTLKEVGLDGSYHLKLYRKLGGAQATGLTNEGLSLAAQRIVLCLSTGNTRLLEYEDTVNGVRQQVFNEREIAHMKDVVNLFARLREVIRMLTTAIYALGALCLALDVLRWKQGLHPKGSGERIARHWACAIVGGTLGWIVLLGAAALVCALRFDSAFLLFHETFFKNDLWLMNPETDLMIRMMPTGFFVGIVQRIALLSAMRFGLVLAFGIGTFHVLKRRKTRRV